jgi:alpha-D-ribose 1-methylphosphonate 5-triphosphate diphosphatase
MSDGLILTNARIVLRDRVAQGTVLLREGRIVTVDEAPTRIPGAVDCEGDYLIPGMVELHTDNLERHFTPRPKVHWHPVAAVMAHDSQMAAAGITTVFDAIACGDVDQGSARIEHLGDMLNALEATQARGHLRADHRIHLRCEVSWSEVVTIFESLVEDALVTVVSVMDHSPGQRQFMREDKYRDYYMGKFHLSSVEMDEFTARQKEASARYSGPNRRTIAEHCRQRGLILASHDDATHAHVAEAEELGVHFSEFPTTQEAAEAAHRADMKVLMGAPNLVRGVSHSGNVSAGTLAQAGCLDILSSDYVPISLMHGVFMLSRAPYGMALPASVAMATSIPADVVGLNDRGAIETGRRADLVRVHDTGDVPVIRTVWREGRQIA